MELNKIFIKNLKYYRNEKGFSQEDLAGKCNLHRTYISLIERDKRNVTLKSLEKISKALDLEPYKLLKKRECY